MFYLLSFFLHSKELFDAFGMEHAPVYAGIVFFGMLFRPVESLLSLLLHAISRRHEYAADRYAAATYGRPDALAEALKKLAVHNLSHLTPHPAYVVLNYSHPPVVERIRALELQYRGAG
jgi:STE24 endopeptidase